MFKFVKLTDELVLEMGAEVLKTKNLDFPLSWFLTEYNLRSSHGEESYYCPNYEDQGTSRPQPVIVSSAFITENAKTCVVVDTLRETQ